MRSAFLQLPMIAACVALALASMPALAADVPAAEAAAPARPRIGLVLSGGGARGAAHVGVLKVLERLRIPLDAIAGTSMGALVGGLYASGMTSAELEQLLASPEWLQSFDERSPRSSVSFRRKSEDQNFLVRFPLGLHGGDFRLPKGLVQGQSLQQLLRRLTLPVADIERFDALPTPFRAVATDLTTGQAVILDSGDLAQAIRASASAPGVFAPVDVGGRLLVDGGLVNNLPIDVARCMGVDVVIAVDAGFPLLPREQLNSVGVISNQMLAILLRRNADMQRATLTAQDLLIEPALGGASSFDFSASTTLIAKGEQAGTALAARLGSLGLPESQYAEWSALRAATRGAGSGTIGYLRVAAGSERYAEQLERLFRRFVGASADDARIGAQIADYYGRGNLELLDYRFEHEGERLGLVIDARRNSWGPNYVRFGLNLQDDFEGNSSFNAAARFVLADLTKAGAEWVWDLQVGESPRIATELHLPLGLESPWFIAPQAMLEIRNVPLISAQRRVAEYRVRTTRYELDFGREFGNSAELRAGFRRDSGQSKVRLGDPLLPAGSFDAREYFLRVSYDALDDVNFPRQGESFTLEWRGERTDLGSVRSADLATAEWLLARSRGRSTGVVWVSGGTNFARDAQIRTLFPLGGFLNLSGLEPDSISGRHFAVARGLYYRKISRGGEGFLNVPAYAGFSLEVGNVWDTRSDIGFDSAQKHGSVFLGLDTLVGPAYFGAGFGPGGKTAYYLFLGRTF
jgi:NTE family protein